jgi:uncharacterized damage-inducible protein DinB
MTLIDLFRREYSREVEVTRGVLERVPDERFDWKPHTKSFSLGQLAQHVATLPQWASMLGQDSLDIQPVGQPPLRQTPCLNRSELLALLEGNAAKGRAFLESANDAELDRPWTLLAAGHTVFTMTKAEVFQLSVMNHLAHHRGQLCTYLRLNDVAVPAVYGPSADEQTASWR